MPSLSDWHDYEPNLEFDDTELTHQTTTNGKITFCLLSMAVLALFLTLRMIWYFTEELRLRIAYLLQNLFKMFASTK